MQTYSLASASGADWTFRQAGGQEWLAAQVPGGVHTDLLAAGRIPDPFFGDNELKVQWVAETDWEYQGVFELDASQLAAPRLFLVADGLDTLAMVTLNGQAIANTDNMFVQYRWDVKKLLKAGRNQINIVFRSAVNFGQARNREKPLTPFSAMSIVGGVFVRKAACHFGWDWGPKLPPAGIWRDLRLESCQAGRIEDVHLRQQHGKQGVTVSAAVKAESWDGQALSARLVVVSPNGRKTLLAEAPLSQGAASLSVLVKSPQLWWPNGYGSQPLYAVKVELLAGGQVEDSKDYQLGLRTVELRREPDEWGESFTFVVNGVPVFMKGADWIPADSFPTRMTEARYEQLLKAAVDTHQNMLRIWGGGYYEEEVFYNLCDRYGILLWHDFMFACYIYPHDEPEFLENLRGEVDYNVKRLRHRTCLALWCGNNEMEQGWADWGWTKPDDPLHVMEKEAYEKYFYHILPEQISQLDPDHPYWPSSASSNTPMLNPNGMERGDMHYWDVWHGRKPFTAYRTTYPRFMSEFGFQSLPPIETVATYADKKDWNMTSYIMEHHQRSGCGNGLMIGQMTDTFRMPVDFPALTYLSMLLQAEGIRYGVEHWRRNKNRVSGTLYWQLNDCWPVASWASLDYFGRWKALHYAAKRFYAPLLFSIEDVGMGMNLYITSDLNAPAEGQVRWQLVTLGGETLQAGELAFQADPLQSKLLAALDFEAMVLGSGDRRRELVLVAELVQDGRRVSRALGLFCPNKHLELRDPGLDVQVVKDGKQARLLVTAHSLARFVELKLAGADVVFSDNYFDVPAGWTVEVSCPIPAGWTLQKLRKTLQVTSLYQSY